jgi:hypothetical protein
VRLSERWQKTVYIAFVVLVRIALSVWILAGHTAGTMLGTVITIIDDAWAPVLILVAIRIFRDPLVEAVAPPRPPWRWTGRPTSGYVLAALLLGATLLSIFSVARSAVTDLAGSWPIIVLVVVYLGLAAGYLNSSIALGRLEDYRE